MDLSPRMAQFAASLGEIEDAALRMTQTRWPASSETDAIVCQLETIATLLRGLPRADHDATTR